MLSTVIGSKSFKGYINRKVTDAFTYGALLADTKRLNISVDLNDDTHDLLKNLVRLDHRQGNGLQSGSTLRLND